MHDESPTLASALLAAASFAAERHGQQVRKSKAREPYVNHVIDVALILARAGVDDRELLLAGLLHDTLEDTLTTKDELVERFGEAVAELVLEVTDDKSLPKPDRKRLQIEHATALSARAKMLKIADKIANIRDVGCNPGSDWSVERRREYLAWSRAVVDGCRGATPRLDALFDETAAEAERLIELAAS